MLDAGPFDLQGSGFRADFKLERHHISVEAKSQLLLHGSIEGIAEGGLPEPLRQFRDVGSIDLVVRQPRELFKTAFAPSCEAAIREILLYDFRHTVCAPSELLFELR